MVGGGGGGRGVLRIKQPLSSASAQLDRLCGGLVPEPGWSSGVAADVRTPWHNPAGGFPHPCLQIVSCVEYTISAVSDAPWGGCAGNQLYTT